MEEGSWKLETKNLILYHMSKIESRVGVIKDSSEKIYLFLSDFNNFSSLIPADRIKEFESSEDSCHFSAEGIGRIGLRIIEKDANKLIKIGSDDNTPIEFQLWIQIKELGDNDSRMKITVEPKVNPMMSNIVNKPLKTFVDSLIEQAENISYNPIA